MGGTLDFSSSIKDIRIHLQLFEIALKLKHLEAKRVILGCKLDQRSLDAANGLDPHTFYILKLKDPFYIIDYCLLGC